MIKLLGGHGVSVAVKNVVDQWKAMTEEVKEKTKKSNAKYKVAIDKHRRKQVFVVRDQVMVFLRQERFPMGTYSKLQPKKYGPYGIIKKINDNTYVVALSDSIRISKAFNMVDIYLYYSSEEPMYLDIPTNLRSSFSQVGETNAEQVVLDYTEKWDRS